jgi:hypothetical protein
MPIEPRQDTHCSNCSASKGECDRLKNDPNDGRPCCSHCNHTGLPR